MFKINQKIRYATIAINFIANNQKDNVPSRLIAEENNLSVKFLEPIMKKLVESGLLKSFRGPYGGYVLKKHYADITMLDVVCAVTGNVEIYDCFQPNKYTDSMFKDFEQYVIDGLKNIKLCLYMEDIEIEQ